MLYFPVVLNPGENFDSKRRSFLYVQYQTFEYLILCLHISLPQGFGGVSQEGYKLQETGQVVQDFIISFMA